MKTLHLVCNAHLDPVWLWQWDEGAGEALSTFRIAADFCEKTDGFVFCHNEAVLYKWIEEYEPSLFRKIQSLVKAGSWHIMGGWYLQPDCNMTSGESLIRHILAGTRYFEKKFGVRPTTAINFDPFGHTRGMVQILAKSGFDSYLFCRPLPSECFLQSDDFVWVGFDGSEIMGHRASTHYNSFLGKSREKVETYIRNTPDKDVGLVLWGIGNHGGGPSQIDLDAIQALMDSRSDIEIRHSTPEAYFKARKESGIEYERVERDINPFSIGCYTSQVRVKQKHRELENDLYLTEKMVSHAALCGLMAYPSHALEVALHDLLFSEFHDILPGSSIQPAEENALRLLDHGLETLSRIKARAFFALAAGQPKAQEGEFPILVYNPHPFPVEGIVQCEFHMVVAYYGGPFHFPVIMQDEKRLPSQPEKEHCNVNNEWRKRVSFFARLEPASMNRFCCYLEEVQSKPAIQLKEEQGVFTFCSDDIQVVINRKTGLMDQYTVHGVEYVQPNAFLGRVMQDDEDSWGMTLKHFSQQIGQFELLSDKECATFLGLDCETFDAVHVIEDGEVRTIIEALFAYENSTLVLTYRLPKQGTEIEVDARVYWNEKSKMLKLCIPPSFSDPDYIGQTAYGSQPLPKDRIEGVAQKWVAACSQTESKAITLINDGVYGSDFRDGEIRMSLVRGPGYGSMNETPGVPILPQDRFSPRVDQGERWFRFWLNAGEKTSRMEQIDREALVRNEKPYVLHYFPSGEGKLPQPFMTLSDPVVQIGACKKAEDDADYIVRLFNPTAEKRDTVFSMPTLGLQETLSLGRYEIKTLKINTETLTSQEVDLLERD
jgi:alpha-mannosidase